MPSPTNCQTENDFTNFAKMMALSSTAIAKLQKIGMPAVKPRYYTIEKDSTRASSHSSEYCTRDDCDSNDCSPVTSMRKRNRSLSSKLDMLPDNDEDPEYLSRFEMRRRRYSATTSSETMVFGANK